MSLQPPFTADKLNEAPLLTPDKFRTLAEQLRHITYRVHTLQWIVHGTGMIGSVIALVWIMWHGISVFTSYLVLSVCLLGLTAIFVESNIRNDKRTAERLARFVENSHDTAQLGTILDLYDTTARLGNLWKQVRTEARSAVTRLLPLIQPADADALNTLQRTRLRRSLFRPEYLSGTGDYISADYYFAVLHVLEQIGDKRDLPDVERLIKSDGLLNEVRTAAERCAQTIRERLAREKDKDVLLRADRKPEVIETLLRPSIETADTPPQQLLRATTSAPHDPPA